MFDTSCDDCFAKFRCLEQCVCEGKLGDYCEADGELIGKMMDGRIMPKGDFRNMILPSMILPTLFKDAEGWTRISGIGSFFITS